MEIATSAAHHLLHHQHISPSKLVLSTAALSPSISLPNRLASAKKAGFTCVYIPISDLAAFGTEHLEKDVTVSDVDALGLAAEAVKEACGEVKVEVTAIGAEAANIVGEDGSVDIELRASMGTDGGLGLHGISKIVSILGVRTVLVSGGSDVQSGTALRDLAQRLKAQRIAVATSAQVPDGSVPMFVDIGGTPSAVTKGTDGSSLYAARLKSIGKIQTSPDEPASEEQKHISTLYKDGFSGMIVIDTDPAEAGGFVDHATQLYLDAKAFMEAAYKSARE